MIFDKYEVATRTFTAERDRAAISLSRMECALETLKKGALAVEKGDETAALEMVGCIEQYIEGLQSQTRSLAEKAASFRRAMGVPTPAEKMETEKTWWAGFKEQLNKIRDAVDDLAEKRDRTGLGVFGSMFRSHARKRDEFVQKSEPEPTGLDVFQPMFGEAKKADPGPKGPDAFKSMFGEQ